MILHHSAEVACVEKERLVGPGDCQALEGSGGRCIIRVNEEVDLVLVFVCEEDRRN